MSPLETGTNEVSMHSRLGDASGVSITRRELHHAMTPIVFGAPGRPLLGAYHAPLAGQAARTTGVVLCSPLGWEGIAAQRALKVLANRLAALGFPVLRFDYEGTGDSPGSELDSGRVEAWLNDIEQAAAELKRLSPVSTLSMVGVHLGATLGAVAGARCGAFESMVMWAPFGTGKAFVRQVRAYRLLNHPDMVPATEGEEEAAGFVLTCETNEALSKLDISARVACKRALLLARDESSPEDKLADTLRAKGWDISFARTEGFQALMQEPRKSQLPEQAFTQMCDWLVATHPEQRPLNEVLRRPVPALLPLADGLTEEACFFGAGERMFGIETRPAVARPEKPMVVFLNTASDHRVGPNRSYVCIARELAKRGFSSFRFDPTGVGDAEETPYTAPHAYSDNRLADVRETLDWLTTHRGARTFVLVGLCSAAYVAFHVGRSDRRVVGELLFNPQTFVWREGDSLDLVVNTSFRSNRAYLQRALDLRSWRRSINFRRIGKEIASRIFKRATRKLRGLLPQSATAPLNIERAFRDTLARKTNILLVLGNMDAGLDYVEMHLGAGAAALKRFKTFKMMVVKGADHTFSFKSAKQQLSTIVCSHIVENF